MTFHGQDYVISTHFSGILWALLPVLKATPLLSGPTFFSVPQPIRPSSSVPIASWSYLLPFLPIFPSPQSSLLPFLPSSWSHLSPLPLGPTSHLSHLLLFLPSRVLPVPPPSAPPGARLFAAFALAGPLCLEHPSAILHLANSKASFKSQLQEDLRGPSSPPDLQDDPCSRIALWTFPL